MFQLNQFITMMKNGQSPERLVMNMLETQMKGTPMGDNLINLARQGNTAEIEKIARNLVAQRGGDFDKEFLNFKRQLGL
jgi:hypothetical protein